MIQEAIIRYLRKHRQESLSPKAVLFDMDGVLYDSMRFHARAWHEVATHHQLTSRPEDFLYVRRTYWGKHDQRAIPTHFPTRRYRRGEANDL